MLSNTFPEYNFVVRPHPSENINYWTTNVGTHNNVSVINDGNVINWIMASNGLISNGCATSIESTILGKPTIGYYPIKDKIIDDPLPKTVSDIAANKNQLADTVSNIINGSYNIHSDPMQALTPHIANITGEFSVNKIIKTLSDNYSNDTPSTHLSIKYIKGKVHNESRTAVKIFNSLKKNHINSASYHQHRFPTLKENEITECIQRYANIMNRFSSINTQKIDRHIFKIAS